MAEPEDPVDRNLRLLDAFREKDPWVRIDRPVDLGLPFWRASWLGKGGVRIRVEIEELGTLLEYLYDTFNFE
jgi:hypothetical protein